MSAIDLLRKLRRERDKQHQSLAAQLVREDAEDSELQRAGRRLELLDRAIGQLETRTWTRAGRFFLVVLVTAVIVTALVLWRTSSVSFALDLHARAASFRLADGARLGAIRIHGPVQLRGLTSVDSPLLDPELARRSDTAHLEAKQLELSSLQLPKGASVHLERQADSVALTVQIPSGAVIASFEAGDETTLSLGANGARRTPAIAKRVFSEPETFVFSSAAPAGAEMPPAAFELVAANMGMPISLELQPRSAAFVEQRVGVDGSREFVSSIVGGTIAIAEVERKYAIEERDVLRITDLAAERLTIDVGTDLRIRLSGSAHRIELQSGRATKPLTPTRLEYLAKNHFLALIWGAAAFIWGALWSIHRGMGSV